ncbi:MAG: hypothetical protein OXE97_09480 [Gammaproteobacteria bacterium]|nr:hypothetical protein [Gammaproteobacteria bacterium]
MGKVKKIVITSSVPLFQFVPGLFGVNIEDFTRSDWFADVMLILWGGWICCLIYEFGPSCLSFFKNVFRRKRPAGLSVSVKVVAADEEDRKSKSKKTEKSEKKC